MILTRILNLFRFSSVINRIYYRIENHKYRHSQNKVYKYRGASSVNSILKGHNTLFPDVICDSCEIGQFTYIQKESSLLLTKIGRFCSIADHVRTGFGSHPTDMVSTYPSFYYNTTSELKFTLFRGEPKVETLRKTLGGRFVVEIGNDVWIGSHVLIMDGVRIGDGAIIAAGAVVTKDVEPYAIYGGVPAKLIRYRFSKDKIESLMAIRWWEKDIDWIKRHVNQFANTDAFIKNFAMDIEEPIVGSQNSSV